MNRLQVLHVAVGHGLPTYFQNAVRSVRAVAPKDPLLIIDNASPHEDLRHWLSRIAEADEHIDLILRSTNDIAQNRKVGSLYSAYGIAFDYAISRGFDLVHIIQGDFQTLWWDDDVVMKAQEIFDAHPSCVNIFTQLLTRGKQVSDDLAQSGHDELLRLKGYGLTDTGLYHLGRWQSAATQFGPTEQSHAKKYLELDCEVICHPWPTDAPIPWPAIVRGGAQRGKEVKTSKPYLLKPVSTEQSDQLKASSNPVWLEDACIPWGWICLTPMWTTGVDTIDYWVIQYRNAKCGGIRNLLPRLELRGVDRKDVLSLAAFRHWPPLFKLFVGVPVREALRALARLMQSRSQVGRSDSPWVLTQGTLAKDTDLLLDELPDQLGSTDSYLSPSPE